MFPYGFLPFNLMPWVLSKLRKERITMVLVTPIILVAITSMIFSSSEHVYPQSTFVFPSERPTPGHIRKKASLVVNQNDLAVN